jgi:serine/threonine protein kinase
MRDATSSDGLHVILKVLDDDTNELSILKVLNEIKSIANHTIELHDIIHTSVANVIALRWRIPFDDYFSSYDPSSERAATFPEQFLEGVAFLHEHRVAHLDLKPENLVVDSADHERPPQIRIIDFDVSIIVESEDTMIEGFRGTPPWVAPEVGMYDGLGTKYSAIFADRWACRRMICYIESILPGGGDGSRGGVREKETIRDRLMSDDPRSRPSLKKVLDAYRRGISTARPCLEWLVN